MSDKGLASTIDEDLVQFNNKKTNKPILKQAKDLSRQISNKVIEIIN